MLIVRISSRYTFIICDLVLIVKRIFEIYFLFFVRCVMCNPKNRILYLCKQRGVKISAVEKSLGLGNGTIRKWKDETRPSGRTLDLLVDYFGVSADYILNGTEKEAAHGSLIDLDSLSAPKAELFRVLMEVPDDQVTALLQMLRSLLP